MKRILFVPPGIQGGWYLEAHFEYLIRYLSDEFFIEQALVPYPPYGNWRDRIPPEMPFMRSPDDYDLIIPLLATHWGIQPREDYYHKTAVIMYEPGEGCWNDVKHLATTTPAVEEGEYPDKILHSVRFGIDTDLFKPMKMQREDNLLHVGVVGSYGNPRRMFEEAIKPLFDLEGVRVMVFPQSWVNNGDERVIERYGGKEFIDHVVTGGKKWPGIPNLYNQLDVLLRCDSYYGYSFPVLEAAACGVPVIATNTGIDHHITEAGGGILIDKNEPKLAEEVREAVIWMRDNPHERAWMGQRAHREVTQNWTWDECIPAWREFLRAA